MHLKAVLILNVPEISRFTAKFRVILDQSGTKNGIMSTFSCYTSSRIILKYPNAKSGQKWKQTTSLFYLLQKAFQCFNGSGLVSNFTPAETCTLKNINKPIYPFLFFCSQTCPKSDDPVLTPYERICSVLYWSVHVFCTKKLG